MTTPKSTTEARMYRGPLGQLLQELDYHHQQAPDRFVRRSLKRGATVSLGRDPDTGQRVLLISRLEAPKGERGAQMWLNECMVFLDYLSAIRWSPILDERDLPPGALDGLEQRVWAAYREPDARPR
jgi:hypothetical protein